MTRPTPLTFEDHNRDVMGLTYVYPVVSRRAAGVSIGINLNTNHACNWACVYCQVPNLTRGSAPEVDLKQLGTELDRMLEDVVRGNFMETHVPPSLRRLNDIAFSGNGEPTSARLFEEAVDIAAAALRAWKLADTTRLVVITNGSFALQPDVQRAFRKMAEGLGEVWFKVDRGRTEDLQRINHVVLKPELVLRRLAASARACPTWVQTCMTSWEGAPPDEPEVAGYLALLQEAVSQGIPLRGVLLYSLARPSHQPEAGRIGALSGDWLARLGDRIRSLGLNVRITP